MQRGINDYEQFITRANHIERQVLAEMADAGTDWLRVATNRGGNHAFAVRQVTVVPGGDAQAWVDDMSAIAIATPRRRRTPAAQPLREIGRVRALTVNHPAPLGVDAAIELAN